MKILTAAEMAAVDRATVDNGLPVHDLMQAAGEAVAAFILRQYPQAARVMVLCGKGNNGADGLITARLLAGEGVGVRVLLLARKAELKGEPAAALSALLEATDEAIVEELLEAPEDLADLLAESDLIVDAIVGTGFQGELRSPAAEVREALAAIPTPVLAIDLPSGWDADSYAGTSEQAFRADAVLTFTSPKPAHIFGHLTPETFGPVVVAPIGTPDALIQGALNLTWTGAAKSLTEPRRPINSNKGMYGHVLVVGGSYGTAGAPGMASLACLRAGAGLVTAAVPREIVPLVAAITPELMVRGLQHGTEGAASLANLEPRALEALLKGIKVIALGPGLSTVGEAPAFARGLIASTQLPMVIDADALNAFDPSHIAELDGRNRTIVLTPHPGEMARLLNLTVKQVEADRINLARTFATKHQVTLVLKGWRTLVAHPDGRVAVNTTGNPALAKGGSGDILTGITAAMLAQHPGDVAEAVEAAVFLHGLAADLAAQTLDEKSVLATDVIHALSQAFQYRIHDQDENTWICGIRPSKKDEA